MPIKYTHAALLGFMRHPLSATGRPQEIHASADATPVVVLNVTSHHNLMKHLGFSYSTLSQTRPVVISGGLVGHEPWT